MINKTVKVWHEERGKGCWDFLDEGKGLSEFLHMYYIYIYRYILHNSIKLVNIPSEFVLV